MAKRDVFDRYAGQALGAIWAIAHPLVLISVYLFIFGYVFRVRIGGTVDLPLDYSVYLLAGLVPWLTIAESLNKATTAITSNASLVKQVVFPLEVLPTKTVLASMVAQCTGLAVLIVYVVAKYGTLPLTYLLLPLVLAMQFLLVVGLSMTLAAFGVFVRDLKDIVQVTTLIGVYLLPVVYLPAMVPDVFRPLLYLNPFTYLVWCYHDVCYYGRFEHPVAWVVSGVLALSMFVIGSKLFGRLRPQFGNVL